MLLEATRTMGPCHSGRGKHIQGSVPGRWCCCDKYPKLRKGLGNRWRRDWENSEAPRREILDSRPGRRWRCGRAFLLVRVQKVSMAGNACGILENVYHREQNIARKARSKALPARTGRKDQGTAVCGAGPREAAVGGVAGTAVRKAACETSEHSVQGLACFLLVVYGKS